MSALVGIGTVCAVVALAGTARDSSRADPDRGDVPGATNYPSAAEPRIAALRGPHRYVSPRGNDRAAGSRRRPWRTIQYAAQRVRPGTTVHVAPGRYAGPLRIDRGGTARRPVRFVSDRRWGASISAASAGPILIVDIRGDHVTFEGFDVSGRGGDGSAAISANGKDDAIIGNHVRDLVAPCLPDGGNGAAGIVVAGDEYRKRGGLVDRNLVERIGSGPRDGSCSLVHGIYASVPSVRIWNNIISAAAADGITSWHAASALSIVNNLSVFNGGSGILVGSGDSGATPGGNGGTLVANNIAYDNTEAGIAESSDGEHPVGPGNRYLHNLVYANGSGDRSRLGAVSSEAIVSGTLTVDPRLAGEQSARQPFCLRSGSPAVDAGTGLGAPRHDFDRDSRPQGRAVDIGPYELSAGSCG